jgi:hypothetical protein
LLKQNVAKQQHFAQSGHTGHWDKIRAIIFCLPSPIPFVWGATTTTATATATATTATATPALSAA